ncbi:hypothetical protein RJT34_29668 [Clitoria ternatea]|uniref:Wax synthase domain-containing protein n=1 Tax=Clitoria ternatea TaxID=43366 RepID=A0AAN9ERY9_CLITE
MMGEVRNFIIIWLHVITSLCVCYVVGKKVPKGFPTLFAILPIVSFFLALPLGLNTMHLGGLFAFFISWLANSKLLLFAFGKGPLSDPSLSLKHFVVVASLPIKIRSQNSPSHKSIWNYIIKALVLSVVLTSYKYMPPMLLYCLYCLHMYLTLEIILAIISVLVRTILGIDLEPHFDEPYLSSSLQDFWGRRWNLVVTNILRMTVFDPTRRIALRMVGPKWAPLPATFMTFLVSGLIHELIYYYLGRVRPTWEITQFFLLHGLCIVVEVGCKKKLSSKFRLPRVVSATLTIGFVLVTSFKLFLPQLLRCNGDQRVFQELASLTDFLKHPLLFLYN